MPITKKVATKKKAVKITMPAIACRKPWPLDVFFITQPPRYSVIKTGKPSLDGCHPWPRS